MDVMDDPKKLRKYLAAKKLESSNDPSHRIASLVKEGVNLGYALAGRNVSAFENGTLKVVSPRFFSVLPDKTEHEVSNRMTLRKLC